MGTGVGVRGKLCYQTEAASPPGTGLRTTRCNERNQSTKKSIFSPGVTAEFCSAPSPKPAILSSSPSLAVFSVTPQGHRPHLVAASTQHSACLRPRLFSGALGYNSPSLHLVILPINPTAQKATPSATGKPGQMREPVLTCSTAAHCWGRADINVMKQLSAAPLHTGRVQGRAWRIKSAAASQSLCLNDLSTV